MAINERDFYASHGLDFDYKNMMDEYIKGVMNQAKIEVLTEIQLEIEESENCGKAFHLGLQMASNIIQQKINNLNKMKEG